MLKDARTLLGTSRKPSNIIPYGSGTYLLYGLERALTDVLVKIPQHYISDNIKIDIDIDGLPLRKNSKSQLWPILEEVARKPYSEDFLIGAYHGYEKPKAVDTLMIII